MIVSCQPDITTCKPLITASSAGLESENGGRWESQVVRENTVNFCITAKCFLQITMCEVQMQLRGLSTISLSTHYDYENDYDSHGYGLQISHSLCSLGSCVASIQDMTSCPYNLR